MRKAGYPLVALLVVASASGCFVSRKETVREVPASSTTVERRSTVETAPTEIHKHTTVETTY